MAIRGKGSSGQNYRKPKPKPKKAGPAAHMQAKPKKPKKPQRAMTDAQADAIIAKQMKAAAVKRTAKKAGTVVKAKGVSRGAKQAVKRKSGKRAR